MSRFTGDVARIGGITPWLKIAHAAEAFDIPVCPHFLMELHVGLCCAVPNSRWVEYIPQLDTITRTQLAIRDGRAYASEEPGLGIDWDAPMALFPPGLLEAMAEKQVTVDNHTHKLDELFFVTGADALLFASLNSEILFVLSTLAVN